MTHKFRFLLANSKIKLIMQQLKVKFCFFFKGEHINFSCQNELLFLKKSQEWKQKRFSLGVLRLLHCAWNCFHLKFFFFLFAEKTKPAFDCFSSSCVWQWIGASPGYLVSLYGNRWEAWYRRSSLLLLEGLPAAFFPALTPYLLSPFNFPSRVHTFEDSSSVQLEEGLHFSLAVF